MIKPSDSYNKMTAREQVAIQLRLPKSGNPWIDQMIIDANELQVALAKDVNTEDPAAPTPEPKAEEPKPAPEPPKADPKPAAKKTSKRAVPSKPEGS